MLKKTIAWALFTLVAIAPALATEHTLRPDHPRQYTVQPGDTLWDISDRFLRDPWFWPEIWYENPQIANPHLIYPGDVIRLVYVDGEPRLTVQRGGGTVKLSPKVRVEDLDEAITTIPVSVLRPFLDGSRIVGAAEYESAPYIVAGGDERVMGAEGDPVYVRGLGETPAQSWDLLRRRGPLVDPETDRVLGFEATRVGAASLVRSGDPATMRITESSREVLPGDRLFRSEDTELRSRFYPRAPERPVEGVIMAVMDGVSQVGQYDVVAINRGASEGLAVGHVLEIFKRGRVVEDKFSDAPNDTVKLPAEKGGELIVFRTFDEMSFGLVMEASRAMSVSDLVRSP